MNTADTATDTNTEIKLTGAQRKALRAYIDGMLRANPLAVETAMLRLFELQTSDEQRIHQTRHSNGCGFNSSSANSGSFFAGLVSRGRHLHPENLERARKIALRHSGQLVDLMVNKLGLSAALALLSK